jgi:hypothetical protein
MNLAVFSLMMETPLGQEGTFVGNSLSALISWGQLIYNVEHAVPAVPRGVYAEPTNTKSADDNVAYKKLGLVLT